MCSSLFNYCSFISVLLRRRFQSRLLQIVCMWERVNANCAYNLYSCNFNVLFQFDYYISMLQRRFINESITSGYSVTRRCQNGEIAHHEHFLLLSQCLRKSSPADPPKCICLWEKVKVMQQVVSFQWSCTYRPYVAIIDPIDPTMQVATQQFLLSIHRI